MAYPNILAELTSIVESLKNGQKVDITKIDELLNHYCENPIVQEEKFGDIVVNATHHPFTDPKIAELLNKQYRAEHKNVDHPNYIKYQLGMIAGLLQKEEALLAAEAYPPEYFDELRHIQERIEKEGLFKADRFGNAVPVDIEAKTRVAIEFVAVLNEPGTAIGKDYVRPLQGEDR